MNSELHPLEPFLPANARVLMLGSFPPKRIRWSMDFFYPNLQTTCGGSWATLPRATSRIS